MKNINSKAKIPGKKGAIARLVILVLFAAIGLLSCFGTIGMYIPKRGLWLAVMDAFSGCGLIFLVGGFFWGLIKWIGFIAPKSFRVATNFWCSWIPLTFFGVYLKVCIWLIIVVAPSSCIALLFSPVFSLAMFLAVNDGNTFLSLGCFLLGGAVVAVMGLVDICKLRRGASVV